MGGPRSSGAGSFGSVRWVHCLTAIVALAAAVTLVIALPVSARSTESGLAAGTVPEPVTVDSGGSLSSVACPSIAQCTAVDSAGDEVTFDPQSPAGAKPQLVDTNGGLQAVACPGVDQCTAVDPAGQAVTFDPGSPTGAMPGLVDGDGSLESVSCPSLMQCTATDNSGGDVTFDPQAPGHPTRYPLGTSIDDWTSVACPSLSQCVAVDVSDSVTTFPPGGAGTTTTFTSGIGSIEVVACPSSGDCTAASVGGEIVNFDLAAPGNPTPAPVDSDAGGALDGIACPSAQQCTTIDGYGYEATFTPATPGTVTPVEVDSSAEPYAIACPSTAQCTIVDGDGQEVTFNPASPTSPVGSAPTTTTTSPLAPASYGFDLSPHLRWYDPYASTSAPLINTWFSVAGTVRGKASLAPQSAAPTFSVSLPIDRAPQLTMGGAGGSLDIDTFSGATSVTSGAFGLRDGDGPPANTSSSTPLKPTGAAPPTLTGGTLTIPLGATNTSWSFSEPTSSKGAVSLSWTDAFTFGATVGPSSLAGLEQAGLSAESACQVILGNLTWPGLSFSIDMHQVCSVLAAGWDSLGASESNALSASATATFQKLIRHAKDIDSASAPSPLVPISLTASTRPLTTTNLRGLSAQRLVGAAAKSATSILLSLSAGATIYPLAVSPRFPATRGKLTVLAGDLKGKRAELVIVGPGYGAARALKITHGLAGVIVRLPRGNHAGRWFAGILDFRGIRYAHGTLRGKARLAAATWNVG